VRPPATDKSGLAAVRDIFEEDKNVKVTEEAGIIKIRIGKVPMAILGTKLPQLSLRPIQQYNPDEVFNAILDTKQMQQAMDSLRFRSVENLSSTRGDTDPRYPHLPAKLQQMTTDQLLDQVSRTWAGYLVVVYGACSGPAESGEGRLFWVGWTGQIVPKSFHR
jgi:hypothetical protein